MVRTICIEEIKVDEVYSEDIEVTENGTILYIGMQHSVPGHLTEVFHVDSTSVLGVCVGCGNHVEPVEEKTGKFSCPECGLYGCEEDFQA